MSDQKPSADDLLKRAKLAQEKLDARTGRREEPILPSFFGDFLGRFALKNNKAWETFKLIWRVISAPFRVVLGPLIGWLTPHYRAVFDKFTRETEGAKYAQRSVWVGASMVGATLVSVYLMIWVLVPATLRFTFDAVAVNLFAYEETLVFGKPEWVVGEPGVLSVFACHKYPCEGQTDSVEFRIRDSFYLDVIRTLTRLEPHDPGELAGAFLSEENACNFTAYGQRIKYIGIYPELIKATCRPINGENAQDVLIQMRELLD